MPAAHAGICSARSSARAIMPSSPNRCSRTWDKAIMISGSATRSSFSLVRRSEEHTSELQSLMRISYAVFCLKHKTNEYVNNTFENNHLKSNRASPDHDK